MTALLRKLFTEEDTFTSRSYHTGLLWGLESIAWSSEYFPEAASVLIRLAEIDPGGKVSNRPFNSAVDILRPWYPQTSATLEQRLSVLRTLVERHPDQGTRLLLALLPSPMGVATPTSIPRFRGWRDAWKPPTNHEFGQFVEGVVDALINRARTNGELWPMLIERLADLPPARRLDIYDELARLADRRANISNLDAIWTALDDLAKEHRTFRDARWALPTSEVESIEQVAALLVPTDSVLASKWLFESHAPNTGSPKGDFQAYERELDQLRTDAVGAIFAESDWAGINHLIEIAKEPMSVGRAIANASPEAGDEHMLQLIDAAQSSQYQASAGFVIRRAEQAGLNWIDGAIEQLRGRPLAQARVLRASNDFDQVWSRLSTLNETVAREYWKEFVPYGLGDSRDRIEAIARSLMSYGRPGAAADLLHLFVGRTDSPIEPSLVADALEAAIDSSAPELRHLATYGIQLLLDYLRSSSFDEHRLGILEWRVFPTLGYGARSPVLERRLSRDSAFFVEILSLVYKRRDQADEERPRPDVVQNAFHLLHEWQIIPGSSEREGEVDESAMSNWLDEARRQLQEAAREEIGLHQIGQVFAYSRTDPDRTWPTLPVRNAIDRIANSSLDNGFTAGTFNKRGVTRRSLTEGGRQEYELADKFDEIRNRIMDPWPRTGRLLRSIAETYRAQGRMEDEQARRIVEGLDA